MPSPERPGTATPGPWKAVRRIIDDGIGWIVVAHPRRRGTTTIAEVARTVPRSTGEADARLIALAPDLAEAVRVLEGAVRAYQDHGFGGGDCGASGCQCTPCTRARAALADPAVVAALAALKGVG